MKVRICKTCPYQPHETGIEYEEEGCWLCGTCPNQGTLRTDAVFGDYGKEYRERRRRNAEKQAVAHRERFSL